MRAFPDLDKIMGGSEKKGGQQGRQTHGRNPQDDQSTGQRGGSGNEPNCGGQEGGGQGQTGGQQGGTR